MGRGKVLVRAPRYPAYMYGDEPEADAKLETPPVFEEFSYRDHLARRGIQGMVAWTKEHAPLSRWRQPRLKHATPRQSANPGHDCAHPSGA